MKSQILGSADLLKKAKDATPQNKNIYINWEALEELPEQFEAVISAVKFGKDLKESFTNVGTDKNPSWMPTTEIMYQIAEAKGISGGENSITEAVYEEVDINPMLRKSMEDTPTYRRIKVGEKVVKFSTVLEEDGTLRRSSPCTQIFNVWDRCQEAWSKEEVATNGYADLKDGSYTDGWGKSKSGKHYFKTWNGKQSVVEPKYENKFKRRSHFDSEMKFAFAKAETKAYTKTIRELAGLMTGYTSDDLKSGELLFAKIRKSSKALQLEQAANLERISGGGKNSPAAALLFGSEPEIKKVEPIMEKEEVIEPEHINGEVKLSQVEEMIIEIECDIENFVISGDLKAQLQRVLKWIKENPDADKTPHWQGAVDAVMEMREVLSA